MSCKLKRNRQRLQSKRDPSRERVTDRDCLTGPGRLGILDRKRCGRPEHMLPARGLVNEVDLRLIDQRPETLERERAVARAWPRRGLGTS